MARYISVTSPDYKGEKKMERSKPMPRGCKPTTAHLFNKSVVVLQEDHIESD